MSVHSQAAISRAAGIVTIVVIIIVAGVASTLILTQGDNTAGTSTTFSSPSTSSSSAAQTSTATKLTPFAFGYTGPTKGSFTPTMYQVGMALDVWKKYGLNVTFVNFAGGEGPLISAIAAGQIQVGDSDMLSFISALNSGTRIRLFGTEMLDAAYTINVPANSSITSLSQVKGTKFTVAVTSVGSATAFETILMMASAGMKQGSDYVIVALGTGPAGFAALQQGKVQSKTSTIPSAIGFSSSSHFRLRYLANSSNLYPKPWIEYGFIATPQFVQQNPGSLKAFIQGYVDAYNYFKNNPDWAINFLTNFYNVDQTSAKIIYGITLDAFTANTSINPQALQNVENLAVRSGIIQSNQTQVPLSEWYQSIS